MLIITTETPSEDLESMEKQGAEIIEVEESSFIPRFVDQKQHLAWSKYGPEQLMSTCTWHGLGQDTAIVVYLNDSHMGASMPQPFYRRY